MLRYKMRRIFFLSTLMIVSLAGLVTLSGASAQNFTGTFVNGCVYDLTQYNELNLLKAIAFAQITVRYLATNYTQTYATINGCYSFLLPGGSYSLIVSAPGFLTQIVPLITTGGGNLSLSFYLYRAGSPVGPVTTTTQSTTTSSSTSAASTTSGMTTAVSGLHVTLQLSTTDPTGNSISSFTRGETVLIKATLTNDGAASLNQIYVVITILDSNNNAIFSGESLVSLAVNQQTTVYLGPTLPSTAIAGIYNAQAVVLTGFLGAGGVPIPGGLGAVSFTVS